MENAVALTYVMKRRRCVIDCWQKEQMCSARHSWRIRPQNLYMLVFIQRKLDLCGGVTAEKFRHFRDSRIFDLFDLSISKKCNGAIDGHCEIFWSLLEVNRTILGIGPTHSPTNPRVTRPKTVLTRRSTAASNQSHRRPHLGDDCFLRHW